MISIEQARKNTNNYNTPEVILTLENIVSAVDEVYIKILNCISNSIEIYSIHGKKKYNHSEIMSIFGEDRDYLYLGLLAEKLYYTLKEEGYDVEYKVRKHKGLDDYKKDKVNYYYSSLNMEIIWSYR